MGQLSKAKFADAIFNKSCESMDELPDDSVNCCVTSPPYYGLRNYESEGQIGLEPSLAEYVARLVTVFREVKRVLRPDGTLWLNLGDTYAGAQVQRPQSRKYGNVTAPGKPLEAPFKAKDQMLVPHAVATALRDDGWWLRDTIVWHKPNPMPSSVTDRTTPAHEYVFLLTKKARYFYDPDAIREPLAESSLSAKSVKFGGTKGCADNETYGGNTWSPQDTRTRNVGGRTDGYTSINGSLGPSQFIGANARSVWSIPTTGYDGAHFAVMPRELVRRCILAGSPAGGLILDPFMGSGTVAEVATGCGRHFVGYELNPEYCKLIQDRLGLFGAA